MEMKMDSVISTIWLPILGLITTFLMGLFKKASSWVDAQAPLVKQVIVAVIASAVFLGAKYLNVSIPDDPSTWTDGTVMSLITAFIAMAFKAIKDAIMKRRTTP
jgi:hypothetical protein